MVLHTGQVIWHLFKQIKFWQFLVEKSRPRQRRRTRGGRVGCFLFYNQEISSVSEIAGCFPKGPWICITGPTFLGKPFSDHMLLFKKGSLDSYSSPPRPYMIYQHLASNHIQYSVQGEFSLSAILSVLLHFRAWSASCWPCCNFTDGDDTHFITEFSQFYLLLTLIESMNWYIR